ncbi:P1 family peptidase [Haliangium sp.]|uniref:P1 family peptidase n=1 Tax=Haliangium sp. TaxID=2663208 RepID=UPI003D10665D
MTRMEFGGSITDVPGVRVGHATDLEGRTGVTVVLFDDAAAGAGLVLGAAASTRGFESLHPRGISKAVHGVCFSGGSTFGLGTTGGVQRYLREQGRGLRLDDLVIPLVPTAIIFDLRVGKPGVYPGEQLGYQACTAADVHVAEGNVGAGTGALVGKLMGTPTAMAGGVGTASAYIDGVTMGVLAVVNAFGDVRDPDTGRIIAGARKSPDSLELLDAAASIHRGVTRKRAPAADGNTTLALVVTDGALDPATCGWTAQMASAGFARAISPVFTQYDGDVVIVLSVGDKPLDLLLAGQMAADLCAHAIVRGVRAGSPVDGLPCAAALAG